MQKNVFTNILMSAFILTMCKINYIMLTLGTVLLLKVLLSDGLGLQTSAYKLQFKGTSISYLPCN